MIETYIQPFLNEWLNLLQNPQKRIFWLYFLSALIIGYLYTYFSNHSLKQSLKKLFSYDSWLGISARADYVVFTLNSVFLFMVSSKLLSKSTIAFATYYFLNDMIPQQTILGGILQDWQVALLFTVVLFICEDFTKYWVHRWLHTIPFLWAFHRVHHSANALNFFTVFRIHPIEAVLFSFRSAITQGLIVGLFFFLFGEQVSLMMILGANAFSFIFNIFGSNLRHSPIALSYPKWLERYLISPAQHHIHHSCAQIHKDKNYGVVFSFWDRWFKSICYSDKSELSYGLYNQDDKKEHKLLKLYISPFFDSFKFLVKSLKRIS